MQVHPLLGFFADEADQLEWLMDILVKFSIQHDGRVLVEEEDRSLVHMYVEQRARWLLPPAEYDTFAAAFAKRWHMKIIDALEEEWDDGDMEWSIKGTDLLVQKLQLETKRTTANMEFLHDNFVRRMQDAVRAQLTSACSSLNDKPHNFAFAY